MSAESFEGVPAVTIVGAGPSGCAFAADLASRNVSVMLYCQPDHPGSMAMIEQNNGYLDCVGDPEGSFKVQTTTDIGLALQHSPFIVVTVPSFGQDNILKTLSPLDLRNHYLIVNVGNFFYFSARQSTNAKAVMETDISPYAVRIEGGRCLIKGTKCRLAIWMAPPSTPIDEQALKRQVDQIFTPKLDWCQSLLQVGLSNINPVVHSPAALMNTGWIESTRGDFYFYAQGMSPSVSKVSERVDEERLAVGRAFGFDLIGITEYMNKNYRHDNEYKDYRDFAQGSVIHNKTKSSPKNMNHRYLLEDIGHCMVPWYELGVKCGLTMQTTKSLIDLASIVSGFDYLSRRGLKAAGLADASKEQIAAVLGAGPSAEADRVAATLSDAHANALEAHAPLQQKAQVAA